MVKSYNKNWVKFKRKIGVNNLKLAKYFSKRNNKYEGNSEDTFAVNSTEGLCFLSSVKKHSFKNKNYFNLRPYICLGQDQQYSQNLHHSGKSFILMEHSRTSLKFVSVKKIIGAAQSWSWILNVCKYALSSSKENLRETHSSFVKLIFTECWLCVESCSRCLETSVNRSTKYSCWL